MQACINTINPNVDFGLHSRQLKRTDLASIYEKLVQVSAKWYNLGLTLQIDRSTLERIQINHPGSCEDRLREMLACSLESEYPPTWSDICNGLKNPTVGRYDIAREIKGNLCALNYPYSNNSPTVHV